MLCTFKLDADDPGAKWMKKILCDYLGGCAFAPAPEWSAASLACAVDSIQEVISSGKKIDAGGRPQD